jgi:hypothetical protein
MTISQETIMAIKMMEEARTMAAEGEEKEKELRAFLSSLIYALGAQGTPRNVEYALGTFILKGYNIVKVTS